MDDIDKKILFLSAWFLTLVLLTLATILS